MALSFSRPVFAAPTTLFSLLALAIAPLVLATPAHADSISIDLDATAVTLQRSGDLYEHTSSLHVHNSNAYGFTLSMNASQPNLVNSKDSSYKIDSVSGTNQKLAADQWGYGMGKNATTFSSVSSASLADITSDNKGSCTSADDCTFYLTLGANIDPKRLPVGSYSTSLTYTATSKPAPVQPSTPSSGGGSSSGGTSYDYWWSVCYDKYPGSDGLSTDKRLYCKNHYSDMSGYQPDWNFICYKDYSSDPDKKSYCAAHDGNMSGYWGSACYSMYHGDDAESRDKVYYCSSHNGDMSGYHPDWAVICQGRYINDSNKLSYCKDHNGDMSGYLDWLCGGLYSGNNDKISYCKDHNGDMSGYREPEPEPEPELDQGTMCSIEYPDDSDKESYCESHNGDMSGYQEPNWISICYARYPHDIHEQFYCRDHHGDVSGYKPDLICEDRYPYDRYKQEYCKSHGGDMSGYPY